MATMVTVTPDKALPDNLIGQIFTQHLANDAELHRRLDLIGVRGNWTSVPRRWIGYDYVNQTWITVDVNSSDF